MRVQNFLEILFFSLLAFFFAPSAFAVMSNPYGWYLELNPGYGHISNRDVGLARISSESGFGGNVDIGYKFLPFFGIEIGGGGIQNTSIETPSPYNINIATIRNYFFGAAARGILPIGCTGFELFGKVGVGHIWQIPKVKNNYKSLANALGFSDSDQNSTGFWVGAGAQYYFTPEFAAGFQWQQVDGDSNTGTYNIYSLVLSYLAIS